MNDSPLDGITTEVIRNNLLSVSEQMRRTLVRTAFNPGIYEVLDFGISMYDDQERLIAEAAGVTSFLGSNDVGMKFGLDYVGRENLEPGDVILCNYPYWSSAHTYDGLLFTPVHDANSTLIGYLAVRAHWRDLGAKDPGYVLDSNSIHQEGLVFPGTKIVKRGVPDHELYEIIRFNSRMPDIVFGDLGAQLSCLAVGGEGLRELHAKFGSDVVASAVDAIISHGERAARRALAELPRGSWSAEEYLDDDGTNEEPVRMFVTVTITDDEFIVDFTGSPNQVAGPVNMPYGATVSMAKTVFKALTTPNENSNAGHFGPLSVIAPEGTLFHAVYPAPTFTLWTHHVATDMVKLAVAQAIPSMGASSAGDEPGFMSVVKTVEKPGIFVISNLEPIGWGATDTHDGSSAQQAIGVNIGRNTPIEVLEQKAGLLHERLELRPDSGGAGRFRGGLGVIRTVVYTTEGEVLSMKKKTMTPPLGLNGGHNGEHNGMIAYPGTDKELVMRMRRTPMVPGDKFVNFSGGGGGFGDPLTRDPASVVEDVLDGYVTPKAAWNIYGVRVTNGKITELHPSRTA